MRTPSALFPILLLLVILISPLCESQFVRSPQGAGKISHLALTARDGADIFNSTAGVSAFRAAEISINSESGFFTSPIVLVIEPLITYISRE